MATRLFSRTFLLLIPLIFPATLSFAQETGKTMIRYSGDTWEFNKDIWADGPRLLGNVVMNHDSAFLYCDSARVNEAGNSLTAYSRVRIQLSDTLNLYSDSLRYDGNSRVAIAYSNVKLVDNQTVLTTDTLTYDRNTRIARYDCWGKIVNDKNFLVSRFGYYYTDNKEFFFKEKVLLKNPRYNMRSDTLKYNTVTEIAYFFGPSHIVSNDRKDSIYCENGWYDTRRDVSRFRKNARIYHEDTFLTGDSMYYERLEGFGQVFRNAVILDTARDILLTGNYGELIRKKGFAFMTDSAVAILADKADSLFLHADTVSADFDTAGNIRNLHGFRKVRFYRHDLQGVCDSLAFTGADSTVVMHHDPVIWSDSSQLSADSIFLVMANGQADSLKLYGSAFIISRDDTASFNQVKGRTVLAKFREGDLYKINVIGNAQTVYFTREEDRTLIGINMAVSSEMLIFLEKNQMKSITYIGNPDAHLYPEASVSPQERKLKNFRWEEERRPMDKADIFRD